MKTMTCKQLGGSCDKEFQAETFEEMTQLSQQHGSELFEKGDEAHMKAMEDMKEKMNDPTAMKDWMSNKQKEFDALPGDE